MHADSTSEKDRPRADTERTGEPDGSDRLGTDDGDGDDGSGDLDERAAARGAVYAALATLFEEPDRDTYESLAAGAGAETVTALVAESELDVEPPDLVPEEDHDTLCARFNDLFTVGRSRYTDRTDGSLEASGPPVPRYESAYREDVSWNDVNVDLARAYDHYGLSVDEDQRDHHDFLPYELEFAGFLARRAAAGDRDARRARRDFLDRHLRVLAAGVHARVDDEPGTGIYGPLARFLEAFVDADRADLTDRLDGGEP